MPPIYSLLPRKPKPMSEDARTLIAEVAERHVFDGCDYCACGERFGRYEWPAHLAAEIDKALGGLTREEQWVPVEESGDRWQPRDEYRAHAALDLYGAHGPMHAVDLDSPVDHIDHESRWVSDWSEAQP